MSDFRKRDRTVSATRIAHAPAYVYCARWVPNKHASAAASTCRAHAPSGNSGDDEVETEAA